MSEYSVFALLFWATFVPEVLSCCVRIAKSHEWIGTLIWHFQDLETAAQNSEAGAKLFQAGAEHYLAMASEFRRLHRYIQK